MEEERSEEIEEELSLVDENLLSFNDNYRAGRYRKATSDLYFAFEHMAKALLLSVGVSPQSHKGVSRMLSYHFVRSGTLPVRTVVYLDNLYERRKTAEYSTRAGWEFTESELDTYRQWAVDGMAHMLNVLKARVRGASMEKTEKILAALSS